MKCNVMLFLVVLLNWSEISLGAITTIPADVTSQIQVTKSGLVYNRNTKTFDTNLTLTNTSQVKIYGPVQLSAVTSNPNSVSLANSTGISAAGRPTLVVAPSGGVLNPGDIIKNIVLKFNDPSLVKFTYEAKFDGVIEVSRIDQLSPSQASSAANITLVGAGFTPASRVMLGTQSVTPQYVSNTQLTFVVPFSLDQNSALVPLQVGQYTIQVDGSNTVNLNVVDLPVNPNPPGQLLTDQITTTFQSLSVNIPSFQANLPQLLSDQQNNPSAQKFIQDLANLANLVNTTSVQTELTKLTNQIDLQTMDTLERSLLVNQKPNSNGLLANSVMIQNAPQTVVSIQTSQSCYSPVNGDDWLACRKNDVDAQETQLANTISDYFKYCSYAALGVTPFTGGISIPIGGVVCGVLSTIFSIDSTMAGIDTAKKYGTVTGLSLIIAGIDGADTQSHKIDELMIDLHLNNYDNNESTPTIKAKYINGATLNISPSPDWTNIANSLYANIYSLPKIGGTGIPVLDYTIIKAIELTSNTVNRAVNPPTTSFTITNANISSISDGLGGGACNHFYDLNSNSLTMQQNNFQWLVLDIGPNLYPVEFRQTISGCKFGVKDPLPAEKNIDSYVQFNVKRYPKITLNVTGEGNVTYSITPVATPASEHTSCTKAKPCVEYFDASTPQLTLTAKNSDGSPATSTTWSGKGAESCIGATATCEVTLDSTNAAPPNITANLSKGVFWVGTYTITNCVAPDYAGSGDPCKFAMKHGAYWNSGEIRFRQDSSEQFNVRRDFTVGGNSSVEACEGYTINIPTGTTGFDFTEDLTGLFSSSSEIEPVHFAMNQSLDNTQSAITGTFTGSFNYTTQDCTTGCPYHLKSGGLVQGTWSANKTNQPFSKCNMQNVVGTGYNAIVTGYTPGWRSPNSIPSAGEWVNFP